MVLHEMRPVHPTAVHKTDRLSELVCSNSFRGDKLDNAVGLLKEEMRRLGSLIMRAADETRVPAGAALAVDRERFSDAVTRTIEAHPLITVAREEVTSIPADPAMFPLIVATGPLTSQALSADIANPKIAATDRRRPRRDMSRALTLRRVYPVRQAGARATAGGALGRWRAACRRRSPHCRRRCKRWGRWRRPRPHGIRSDAWRGSSSDRS